MDKQNHGTHNNMSPVRAGITGFVLGMVGTAAIAMADKNTRTKVTKKANELRDSLEKWSKDTLHDLQATGDEVKKRSAESAEKDMKTSSIADRSDELKEKTDDMLSDERRKIL